MNLTKTDDYFTCKKIHVSFILAMLVFSIHISSLANYECKSSLGVALLFIERIIVSCAEVAVPLFFILSGVLFYRNYNLNKTIEKYKSRFKSLVIPYLFWNFIWTIFQYACSYTFISRYFVGREKAVFSIKDLLQGVFLYKYTIFWFIFDLLVFVMICPMIYIALKNKIVGAATIVIVTILYANNIQLPVSLFFRGDAIIYYLFGAYIGMHFFDIFIKPFKKLSLIAIIVCICSVIYLMYGRSIINSSVLYVVIMLLFCIAFWYAFDLFSNKLYLEFEKESFLIYAMHVNVSAIVTKLIFLALPKSDLFALVNYLLTVIITIAAICIFGFLVEKFSPGLKKIIGGR